MIVPDQGYILEVDTNSERTKIQHISTGVVYNFSSSTSRGSNSSRRDQGN